MLANGGPDVAANDQFQQKLLKMADNYKSC